MVGRMSGDPPPLPGLPTGRSGRRRSAWSPGLRHGRRRRWWIGLAVATVAVLVATVAYGLHGRSAPSATTARSRAAGDQRGLDRSGGSRRPGSTGSGGAPTTTTTTPPPPTTTTGPGTLPQTDTFPTATSPQFQAEMQDLWQGVVTGSVTPAMPAFFPEGAYLQLKTIAGVATDWEHRLVADYALDLGAAHALLGSDPAAATLVSVNVPSQYGHWVPPGVCYNSIGYFEVPNARVVYQHGGVVRSFGIASMISWRGEWYVVHLGAVLRTSAQGVVDTPATGPGTSAYSSTC